MAFGLLKRILGHTSTETPAAPPATAASKPGVVTTHTASASAADTPAFYVQRTEMLDARSRIAGYRCQILPMSASSASQTAPTITCQQLALALRQDQLERLLEQRQAVLVLDNLALHDGAENEFVTQLAGYCQKHCHFFLTTPDSTARQRWLGALQFIRQAGGSIAVDVEGYAELASRGEPEAELLLLDLHHHPLEALEAMLQSVQARSPNTRIALSGVQSWQEHALAQGHGVSLCLGPFTTTSPTTSNPRETITQSRLVLMEMLNLMRRNATAQEIAEVAKRDPAVAVKVLSMVNSPLSGLRTPVTGFEQAMLVLGRDALYRWLSLSLFRTGNRADERDETLLEMALFRARLLELLASASRPKNECDELFLVGLLSLADSLLGQNMQDIVASMHLPPHVTDVLLGQGGPYSSWLLLALALERGRLDRAQELLERLNLPSAGLEAQIHAARHWTSEAMQNH